MDCKPFVYYQYSEIRHKNENGVCLICIHKYENIVSEFWGFLQKINSIIRFGNKKKIKSLFLRYFFKYLSRSRLLTAAVSAVPSATISTPCIAIIFRPVNQFYVIGQKKLNCIQYNFLFYKKATYFKKESLFIFVKKRNKKQKRLFFSLSILLLKEAFSFSFL